jgi:hypothetical protein
MAMGAKKKKSVRLNLRVPGDLNTFVRLYAKEKGTTITEIVIGLLKGLKHDVETSNGVEQF